MKKIGSNDVIGERGVVALRSLILEIGFVFYETGGVEAGIDGYIELRDTETQEVSNLILQAQCKTTTRKLPGETEESFEWPCKQADVDYWRGGTAPVILVVVNIYEGQTAVYWKSIKDYFSDRSRLQSKKIEFDKDADRLTKDSGPALMALAQSIRPGTVTPSVHMDEDLALNLLKVSTLPEKIYWAPADFANNKAFGAALREIDPRAPSEWVITSRAILCLHDLDTEPWRQLCDTGAIEEFDAEEWAFSDDPDRQRDFVQLLNRCLKQKTRRDLWSDRETGALFFKAQKGRNTVSYSYRSDKSQTARNVVKRYTKKKNPKETAYFRHSAFFYRFHRFGDEWFVEVTPTYRFSWDGYKDYRFSSERLKKIKELENNAAVFGQFLMWQHYLCSSQEGDLLEPKYPFLGLEPIEQFQVQRGVPDKLWQSRETNPSSPLFSIEDLER